MEINVPVNNLKIGMYIRLNLSWMSHPFIKSHFLLTSQDQIRKLMDTGVKDVRVDFSKSLLDDKEPVSEVIPEPPKSMLPESLRETIFDKTIPPLTKATQVHEYTEEMIKNLLDNPTVENIVAAKQAIAHVVDLILDDIETSQHLMMITDHDYYTYTHSVHVGILSVCLARNYFGHSNAHNLYELGVGFFLHDLGKIRIDQGLIQKAGELTDEETEVMKQHPYLGYTILHETKQMTEESKIIILQHHERYDGTGYPEGLKGSDLHIYGKICSIADVYDALTTDRPYRKKLKPFEGLKIMKEQMINHFQKDLFDHFVLMIAGRRH